MAPEEHGERTVQQVLLAGGANPGNRLLQDPVPNTENVGKAACLCFSLARGRAYGTGTELLKD